MKKSDLFEEQHNDAREGNGKGIAASSLKLNELFIEKMKSDPNKWNAFLQKGRSLYALCRTLNDINI